MCLVRLVPRAGVASAVAMFIPLVTFAQQPARDSVADRLRLYYVGYPIGWERYELKREAAGGGYAYTADFDYVDRGRPWLSQ
jgi:hypothetical protein